MPLLKPKIIEKTVLVPIFSSDKRAYIEKWQDDAYLKAVKAIEKNDVFVTEAFEALKRMRLAADDAKTTEELAGIRTCIKIMHRFVTISEHAKRILESGGAIDESSD